MSRAQAPELRVPFLLAPIQRRSQLALHLSFRRVGARSAGAYVRELEDGALPGQLARAEADYRAVVPQFAAGSLEAVEGALLYALVRSLKPETVVETGTANGVSSAYLLAALAANGAGRLVSIDLPFEAGSGETLVPRIAGTSIDLYDASPIPAGRQSGWMIPDELRDRWSLRLGDARQLLPAVLAETGSVDLFFHDSLHTREHMLFEFETVWPHLVPGGLLAAEDIFQRKHDALPAFARSVGRPLRTFGNIGLIRR